MNKKAVQLGLNTIVVAVLAITAMTVMLFFFTGQFGDVRSEVERCDSVAGTCIKDKEDCETRIIEEAECPDDDQVCCFDPMGELNEDEEVEDSEE